MLWGFGCIDVMVFGMIVNSVGFDSSFGYCGLVVCD